jgi:hypothetical protein
MAELLEMPRDLKSELMRRWRVRVTDFVTWRVISVFFPFYQESFVDTRNRPAPPPGVTKLNDLPYRVCDVCSGSLRMGFRFFFLFFWSAVSSESDEFMWGVATSSYQIEVGPRFCIPAGM